MVNPLKTCVTLSSSNTSLSSLSSFGDEGERGLARTPTARPRLGRSTFSRLVGTGLLLIVASTGPTPTRSRADGPGATPATPSDSLKEIDAGINALTTRLKTLQDRLAATAKTDDPSDLDAVRNRIEGLAKSVKDAAPLKQMVEALDKRADDLDKQVGELRERIKNLKSRVETTRTSARERTMPTGPARRVRNTSIALPPIVSSP